MDTRQKIIPAEAAPELARKLQAAGTRLKVVSGEFDVLLAAHARDLRQVRNGTGPMAVMVVLSRAADALLPDRARAELAAALDMVDYVVIMGEQSVEDFLAQLAADEILDRRDADKALKQFLIEHVQQRHRG